MLEKLLTEAGRTRLTATGGASSIVVTSPDESGTTRERFRLVAMANRKYRVEFADGGRWKDARVSGAIEKIVADLLKSHASRLG